MYYLFFYIYHPMCDSAILLGSLYSGKKNTGQKTANLIFTYPTVCQITNSPLS